VPELQAVQLLGQAEQVVPSSQKAPVHLVQTDELEHSEQPGMVETHVAQVFPDKKYPVEHPVQVDPSEHVEHPSMVEQAEQVLLDR
jgi:hypothetical protein